VTPKTAEAKLIERKRKKRRTGPMPLSFTIPEIDAVRTLAAHGHSQATIASRAGLTSKQFKKAREKDERLDEAMIAGRAEEKLRITTALLKTATDSSNPRQVQAAVTLAKMRHGFRDGSGGGGVEVNVTNQLAIPGPLDARTYRKLVADAVKDRPVLIEQKDDEARPLRLPDDPVGSVLSKRRESRDD
jgi:hypothetical protein